MKHLLSTLLLFTPCLLIGQDTLPAVDEEEDNTLVFKTDFIHFYYAYDSDRRAVYTDHGVFDAHQALNDFGHSRSYSVGFGWTHYFRENLGVSGGVELHSLAVTTDTLVIPNDNQDRRAVYTGRTTYCNIPLGVRYSIGKKFRIGAYGGVALKFKIYDGGDFYKNYYNGNSGNVSPYGETEVPFPMKRTDRFNADARIGMFAEYGFKKIKLRITPVYRVDLFDTFKYADGRHASSKGLQFEILF